MIARLTLTGSSRSAPWSQVKVSRTLAGRSASTASSVAHNLGGAADGQMHQPRVAAGPIHERGDRGGVVAPRRLEDVQKLSRSYRPR